MDTMKSRYIIGFFTVFLFAGIILAAGYQFTYNRVMERQAAQGGDEIYGTESIAAEGGAVKNTEEEEGYYLRDCSDRRYRSGGRPYTCRLYERISGEIS